MACIVQSQELGVRLSCSVLKAYGHVLYRSPASQDAFEQRVGYDRLRKLLTAVATPTKEILLEALNIVRITIVCLSVVCLSVCLSVYLSVYLSIQSFIYLLFSRLLKTIIYLLK